MTRTPRLLTVAAPRRRRRGAGVSAMVIIMVIAGILTAAIGAGLRMDTTAPRDRTVDTAAGGDRTGMPTAASFDALDHASAGTEPSPEAPAAAAPDSAIAVELPDETRWFNGRPIRAARILRMKVTAYSPDERSCGPFADGVTASGYSVWTNGMKLVAADTAVLPFRSLVSVPGYDQNRVVPVLDRGGRIKGLRLDVLFPTHRAAMKWGVRELDVIVWEYADGG